MAARRMMTGLRIWNGEASSALASSSSFTFGKNISRRWSSRGLPRVTTGATAARQLSTSSVSSSNRLKVVLDIDECMVHTMFDDELREDLRQAEYRPDQGQVKSVESLELKMADGATARVNKRPKLDWFLKHVLEEFETYTFTAAMEIYAAPLLDMLDAQRKLKGRFYRQHCTSQLGLYLKDLSLVGGEDLSRVVLVDNNPISFLLQPDNGIPVESFYDQTDDTALEEVLEILRTLDKDSGDVRPTLKEMFGLKKTLEPLSKKVFVL